MKYKQPLRKILIETESHWDKPTTRPAVRRAYKETVKCRTFALGALLFASQNELRLVPGTCKSRGCPSCGQRNTEQWQREQWAALPDIPYKGITLTMPDVLWPLFQPNRKLLACLSTLGAKVIENWGKEKVWCAAADDGRPPHFWSTSHLQSAFACRGFRAGTEGV
jgi:hypothetical protein